MAAEDRVVEAAGGVLWQRSSHRSGLEVGLVHRPKYDDWSLPKGKLHPGEHPLLAAAREVEEETGYLATIGRPLGEIRYAVRGMPKRVRYWAMRSTGGAFEPNDEVDRFEWLEPADAQRRLTPDRDRGILDAFLRDPSTTWPCLLVRHAQAGERAAWSGDDRERPLVPAGEEQASALTDVLAAYGVQRVLSADVVRCIETVAPYAAALKLTVESEPLFSESGYLSQRDPGLERFLDIVCEPRPTVVCSQGKTIPDLLARACTALGHEPPGDTSVRKGGWWALHMASTAHPHLVALEVFGPPT